MERSDYKCGDILFCSSKRAMSKTILKAIKGNYSHTAQVIEINEKLYVIDAQAGGIMPRRLEHWESEFKYKVDVLRPTTIDKKEWTNKALWYCGIKYDKKHLLIGLFKSLLGAKKINSRFRNNGKFVCFEYTAKLLGMWEAEQQTAEKIYSHLLTKNFKRL